MRIWLTIKNRWGNHYAMLTTAGITIGLHPGNENLHADSHISVGFMIDDLDGAKKLLENNGVTYKLSEDKAGDILNFKDPDGTLLYFMKLKW
ncbi:MAG: Glyoxalase-like protein [Bacteroidota bacterium]|nr:Glyoxalase-like protein [Bacteroidota bacterium]